MSHTRTWLVEHRHGLEHAEVDEPGLLEAGDDLDLDARLARARSRNSARFSASRTARVATARIGAPWMSATCRNAGQRLDAPARWRRG